MSKWYPEHYSVNSQAQSQRAYHYLERINFKGNEVILDIGFGDGLISQILSEKVPRGKVIAIDSSLEMTSFASQKFSNIPNLEFYHQNAENMTYQGIFDFVVSFNALHWIQDHEGLVKKIRLALKPRGRIVLIMASGTENQLIHEVLKREKWRKYFIRLNAALENMRRQNYRELLNKEGFQNIEVSTQEFSYQMKTKNEILEQIMTWLPFTTSLPVLDCKIVASEIADLFDKNRNKSGEIDFKISMLAVLARLSSL